MLVWKWVFVFRIQILARQLSYLLKSFLFCSSLWSNIYKYNQPDWPTLLYEAQECDYNGMSSIGRITFHYLNFQKNNRFLCPTISNFGSADLKLVLLHELIFMFYNCLFFALLLFFVLHHRNPIGTFLIGVIEVVFFPSKHFIAIVLSFLDCQVIWLLISEGLLLLSKVFQSQNVFKVCDQVWLPIG